MKKHMLTSREFKITDDAIYTIIESYTGEAGVRNLEKGLLLFAEKQRLNLKRCKIIKDYS